MKKKQYLNLSQEYQIYIYIYIYIHIYIHTYIYIYIYIMDLLEDLKISLLNFNFVMIIVNT